MNCKKEKSKRLPPKHKVRTNPEFELPDVCEGIIPWYQAEVYGLAKHISDETDKMIIQMLENNKWEN